MAGKIRIRLKAFDHVVLDQAAADIVRTVAITPTLEGLAVLAMLVAIRTFLSWSLALELDGRWPWQRA